jgi:hypothetical protein
MSVERDEGSFSMDEEWEQVGTVGIDSGTLALVDPSYAHAASDALDAMGTQEVGVIRPDGVGLGLIVSTGVGDGRYNVEIRREEVEGRPGDIRIAEVRVRFL